MTDERYACVRCKGVGKSCLLLRFSDDQFTTSFITTIGYETRGEEATRRREGSGVERATYALVRVERGNAWRLTMSFA